MNSPLAERLRPQNLDEYVGQEHLVGKNGILRRMLDSGRISSLLLWGPPGVGKTTLARILAQNLKRPFFSLSAINSGVKDLREVIDQAKKERFFTAPQPLLFIDEIHRFSKSQQDSLLGAVEQGTITLIGATTENPSFEVIPALLSRCQVYVLKPLTEKELRYLVDHALTTDEILKKQNIVIQEYEALFRFSGGDARKLLNCLEICVQAEDPLSEIILTNDKVMETLQQNLALYDKTGEMHYDLVSAFIKSIRGSDPDASVYYLARMLEGGEDLEFICRRLIILASEDIGLANANALLMAMQCLEACRTVGMPEARIILSQATIYLALSAKSNATYLAIDKAIAKVRETGNLPVPLHLRNAPTNLMKSLGYGKDYKYPHDYENNWVAQQYLPDALVGTVFFERPKKN